MIPVRRIGILLLALAAAGCASIIGHYSGRTEACAILAIGQPARAEILQLLDTGTRINDDPVVEFVLEVRPEGKPPYQARTRGWVSQLDIPAVQPGRVVPVKFDLQVPSRVAMDVWDCPNAVGAGPR